MLIHQGTNTIETLRLRLRRFTMDDAEDMFYNWASDPEVCKYLAWGPHRDIGTTRRRIASWVNNYEQDNCYVWAIELITHRKVIGTISVELSNESTGSCEVGYCIGRAYWGLGIMTEALRTVMHYLFYEIGYQRIQAKHDVLNVASGKVMQKAGMHFERMEYRVGARKDGSYYDLAVYSKHITDE